MIVTRATAALLVPMWKVLLRHINDASLHSNLLVWNVDLTGSRAGTSFTVNMALEQSTIQLKCRGADLRPGKHFTSSVGGGVTTINTAAGTSPFGVPGTEGEFYIALARRSS